LEASSRSALAAIQAVASLLIVIGSWPDATQAASGLPTVLFGVWIRTAALQACPHRLITRRLTMLGMAAGAAIVISAILVLGSFALPRSAAVIVSNFQAGGT
jgi:hypothetical protein